MMAIRTTFKGLYRSNFLVPVTWKRYCKELLYENLPFLFSRFRSYQTYVQHKCRYQRLLDLKRQGLDKLSLAKDIFVLNADQQLEAFLLSGQYLLFSQPADTKLPRCTVIVVLYNQASLTYSCLRSLAHQIGVEVHLVIVDNSSSDRTPELLSRLRGNVRIIRNQQNLHFLAAANQAFDLVREDLAPIVLVNNDAILEPLAINAALTSLERFPLIGAVCGMILHLDGRLQEAGSQLFSDGSCVGVGRRGDPLEPLWNARRLVDFGSGCFLTLRSEVIHHLSGFDTLFSPAYYEETDLCLRLQEAGWHVLYEPTCRAIHVEYASSGGSIESVEHLLVRNQQKFAARHASRLSTLLASANFSSLDPRSLMNHLHHSSRILWIDDHPPRSSFGAGFARLEDITSTLADLGCWITVFATTLESSSAYQRLSSDYELRSGSVQELVALLQDRSGFYTHICASRSHNIQLLSHIVRSLPIPRPVLVADVESLFSVREWTRQYLNKHAEMLTRVDLDAVPGLQDEIRPLLDFDRLIAVSESEALLLKASTLLPTCCVGHRLIPHEQSASFDNRAGILFLGAIHERNSPNYDSLQWLYDEILPAFDALDGSQSIPITIAGQHEPELVRDLYQAFSLRFPRVKCIGYCADLNRLLDRHRVFIAPTRFAAGLPHKIHQAAAHGLPVVTTPLIADQMRWADGVDLLVAGTAPAFARAMTAVYYDASIWQRLSISGFQRISGECHPSRMVNALKQAFDIPDAA